MGVLWSLWGTEEWWVFEGRWEYWGVKRCWCDRTLKWWGLEGLIGMLRSNKMIMDRVLRGWWGIEEWWYAFMGYWGIMGCLGDGVLRGCWVFRAEEDIEGLMRVMGSGGWLYVCTCLYGWHGKLSGLSLLTPTWTLTHNHRPMTVQPLPPPVLLWEGWGGRG